MRNPFSMVVLVVVFFSVAGFIKMRQFNEEERQLREEKAIADLHRDYYERVGWIRSNPDEKAYRDEVRGFFRWYFGQVDNYLAKFHEHISESAYLEELEKNSGKDLEKRLHGQFGQELTAAIEKKASNNAEKKEFFDQENKILDSFRSGNYQPVFSGSDKGMRLDVASSEVTIVEGKPKIRFSIVLWGAPREMVEVDNVKRMRTDLSFSSSWKLLDAKGKLYGEMNVGNLAMRNDVPERLIPFFPPQTVLGNYDMDLVPAVVDHMEISFDVTAHSPTGGTADAVYTWKLATPVDWKLKPGDTWEGATEQMRSMEEINSSAVKKQAAK